MSSPSEDVTSPEGATQATGSSSSSSSRSFHTLLIRGGFQAVTHNHYFRQSNVESGRALYKAGHVLWAEEKQQHGHLTEITAECLPQTNINNKPYRIELQLDGTRQITDGRCQCVAGIQGHCKHAAALFHYVNSERNSACTDKEQVWHKPAKSKQALYCKGLPADEIFNLPPTPSPTFSATQEYKDQLRNDLAKFNLKKSSLYKSLDVKPEQHTANITTPSTVVPDDIRALFFNEIVVPGSNLDAKGGDYYKSNVKVSRDQAIQVWMNTTSQSTCPVWYSERKKRVTASKAHQLANARKSETALKYFKYVSVDHVNLQYGRTMEPLARNAYEQISGNKVFASGLFIKPCQSWICCTPDGIAQDSDGNLVVLEIKCPVSCQRSKINVPWLSDTGLKESHPYYCQVQMQLYCCNLEKAHFFVFSENDCVLIEIMRNDSYL